MKVEIKIHGTFGKVSDDMPWFVGESIASQIDYYNSQNVDEIQLRINSMGGYVADLIDIVNAIARSKAKISTFVEGMAKSCGLFLALCGKDKYATSYSIYTAHNPFNPLPEAMDSEKQMLAASRESLLQIVSGAGIDTTLLSELMDNNTTFTAEKAKEYGFVDRVVKIDFTAEGDEKMKMMAFSKFAVMNFIKNEKSEVKMDENKELSLLLAFIGATDVKGAVTSLTDLKNQVQNLVSENNILRSKVEEIQKSRVSSMVDKAIEEKRIDPAQRETVMAFCVSAGEEKAAGFLAGLKPTIVNLDAEPKPNPAAQGDSGELKDFDFSKYVTAKHLK